MLASTPDDRTITVRREWFALLLHCLAEKDSLENLAVKYPGAIAAIVRQRQQAAFAVWMDGMLVLNEVDTTDWQSPIPPL